MCRAGRKTVTLGYSFTHDFYLARQRDVIDRLTLITDKRPLTL